jgi:hypothetical protein
MTEVLAQFGIFLLVLALLAAWSIRRTKTDRIAESEAERKRREKLQYELPLTGD